MGREIRRNEGMRKNAENNYENIRVTVRVRGAQKHERMKKVVRYLGDQEQTHQEIFLSFEDHLMQLH